MLRLHIDFNDIELEPKSKAELFVDKREKLQEMGRERDKIEKRLRQNCLELTEVETHEITAVKRMIQWAQNGAKKALAALDQNELMAFMASKASKAKKKIVLQKSPKGGPSK